MKKNFKRTLAKVMAVALTVAMAGTIAPDADAAKKIKLSNKSITVTKGKTKKVTIKNVKAKKVKKLTVKTNKKKVATVKKSGKTAFKVTGKKAGSAKITATVKVKGQKKATKLTLKVKVKNAVVPNVTTAPTTAPTVAPTAAASTTPAASTQPGTSAEPTAPTTPAPTATAPTTPGPTDPPIVESYATEIKNIQLAGEMKEFVKSFEVNDGAVTLEMSKNATYDHVYTYFDYTIPEGTTLDDILAVRFDYNATGADCQYKDLCILAGEPETFPMKGLSWDYSNKKPGDGAANVSKETISTSSGTTETNLPDQEIEVVSKDLKKVVAGDTVRFCIYLHISGASDEGVSTKYTLNNIKVMSKTEGGKDAQEAPGATIDNTQKAVAVAAASVDTMKIKEEDFATREITLTVPQAKIEAYGVQITEMKIIQDEASQAVLSVTDNNDNTYTVKVKDGYTLPEDKAYETASVKVKVDLNTGGALETTFNIVVGDDSVVDISSLLGKIESEYVLLDLSENFIRDEKKEEISVTSGTKGGVDILTYDISATGDDNLWIGWDFSNIDMTEATEVIFLVKSEGAGAKLASVGANSKDWLDDIGYADPKADEFTKVTVSADNFATYMGIKGNSWNGALDIYAVAVVGGKAK